MDRRTWLVLGWGIIVLTVVDAVYLAVLSSYVVDSEINGSLAGTEAIEHLYGPVVLVLRGLALWFLGLVERNDKVIVALSGLAVAIFTATLWRATTGLQALARKQSKDTERALQIAERTSSATSRQAEVTVRGVAPFLLASAYKFNLHPESLQADARHRPSVAICFENVGATPAILRRIGAKLMLIERDVLPEYPPALEDIPAIDRSDVIGAGQKGGEKIWRYDGTIGSDELFPLKRTDGPLLRFYVMGYVVYEDVFGGRTTHRFCLKVRQNGFDALRGGAEFNRAEYDANPEGQPKGRAEEEPRNMLGDQ